MPDLITGRFRP